MVHLTRNGHHVVVNSLHAPLRCLVELLHPDIGGLLLEMV